MRKPTKNNNASWNGQVFVTKNEGTRAVRVHFETSVVADVIFGVYGKNTFARFVKAKSDDEDCAIDVRLPRTGQKFPLIRSSSATRTTERREEKSLHQLGVQNNDHFVVQPLLLGGGGDGGATGAESRSAYLEMYNDNPFAKKKETLGGFVSFSSQSTVRDFDKKEDELSRYFNCSLTEEKLDSTIEDGIVIDLIGNLYNKEAVLKCLQRKAVEKTPLPMRIEHVTGLKALVTCKFHKKEEDSEKTNNNSNNNNNNNNKFRPTIEKGVFSCPLTGLDFNGKTKFVVLRPSGVGVSEKAIREAKEIFFITLFYI